MGLIRFFAKAFSPSTERLNEKEEERQRNVLIAMVERCRQNKGDCPHFWTIFGELRRRGRYIPSETLASTMRNLARAGFVRRLDGSDALKNEMDMRYEVSARGVNRAGYFNCYLDG